jgi:hypothetical protein
MWLRVRETAPSGSFSGGTGVPNAKFEHEKNFRMEILNMSAAT